MDVDKLFKLPKVPQASLNKRKWSEPSKAVLQSAQFQDDNFDIEAGPSEVSLARSSKAARVSQEDDDLDDESSREFAPGNDADYFVDEDDDGGRFFGGGLTLQQKRILEIMNSSSNNQQEEGNDDAPKAEEQLKKFRKSLVKLERAINKNQEMRARFSDDPSKYIESEADLDAAIKALVISTTNPPLFYPDMIHHGSSTSLCSLLSHENVDITASVIELLEEFTDDDVLDAGEEGRSEVERENSQRKGEDCMQNLLDSLLDQSIVELLVQNLSRFNDDTSSREDDGSRSSLLVTSDAGAIYHLLGLVENLVSLRSNLALTFLSNTILLDWLLRRIARKGTFDQNKAYAAELLGILMQIASSQGDRRDDCTRVFGERGGIATLLDVLATFRKKEPKDDEESEFMENIFDVLCTALTLSDNKKRFYKEEGTELMCILMKAKGVIRLRAVKALNHAFSGPFGSANCVRFVENQGLKTLFGIFMGKLNRSVHAEASSQDEEHILELIMSLFNNLKSESIERIRLVSKFVEKEYEKVDRLIELRTSVNARLTPVQKEIEESRRRESSFDEQTQLYFYLERVEHGLFSLQLIDYILAWLIMEDDGVLHHVEMIFARTNSTLEDIIVTLKEYYDNVGDDAIVSLPDVPKGDEHDPEDGGEVLGLKFKDVLVNLVNYILSVL